MYVIILFCRDIGHANLELSFFIYKLYKTYKMFHEKTHYFSIPLSFNSVNNCVINVTIINRKIVELFFYGPF